MPRPPKFIHPIRALREILGPTYTQKRFAKLIGISTSAVQRIELGKLGVSFELALRISGATGVAPRSIQTKRGKPKDFDGGHYTRDSFDRMRNAPANAPEWSNFHRIPKAVEEFEIITRAALAAGKIHQFLMLFEFWQDKVISDFDLSATARRVAAERQKRGECREGSGY